MNQLTILLTGEIQSSNFVEWKNDLINQIHTANTHLLTDEDFLTATQHVKLFKTAEISLKEAKQSAINQATEIQELFAAIDEVSAEARAARLVLERQIKSRKQEIKEELISLGIDQIHEKITQQSSDFQLINHSNFVDFRRFEAAVKGKPGIRTIELAVNHLCSEITQEISIKAAEVQHNALAIDALSSNHKLLFQDRASLLAISQEQLKLTIDKRIALFNAENATVKAEKVLSELEQLEDAELNPEDNLAPETEIVVEKRQYRLVIDILSTRDEAIEIARSIKQNNVDNPAISSVRLKRYRG